jgi:hypothetical protein
VNEEFKIEATSNTDQSSSRAASYELDAVQKRIDILEDKIKTAQFQFIEVIGIFVALFTFVSVDIQIFRANLTFTSIIGFTLVTLGGLVLFISLLHLSLKWSNDFLWTKPEKQVLSISMILVLFGVILVFCARGEIVAKIDFDKLNSATEETIKGLKQSEDRLKKCTQMAYYPYFKDCINQ